MKFKFGVIKEEKKPLSYYVDKSHPLYEDLLSLIRTENQSTIYESRANTEYVVDDLTGKLIKTGRVNLVGQQLKDEADIVNLARIIGNKKFETSRILYVKDDKVVGQDAVTIDIVDACYIHSAPTDEIAFAQIKQKMDRLGADGYYIVHNHPSGNSAASKDDLDGCSKYAKSLPGFLGGIVIGDNNFSFIEVDDNFNASSEFFGNIQNNRKVFDSKVSVIEYINDTITNIDGSTFVIYVDISSRLISLQRIADKEFNDKNIFRYISNERHNNGAKACFLVTSSEDVYWKSVLYTGRNDSMFLDVFYFDGNVYRSARAEYDYLATSSMVRDSKIDNPKIRKQKL